MRAVRFLVPNSKFMPAGAPAHRNCRQPFLVTASMGKSKAMKPSSKPPTKTVDSPWTAFTSLSFQHETRQEKGRKHTSMQLTVSVQIVKPLLSWVARKVMRKRALLILVVVGTAKAIGVQIGWGTHLGLILWSTGIGAIFLPGRKP